MTAFLKRRELTIGSPSGLVASFLGRLLTTRGDILRRGSSIPERLAIGAAGSVLQSDGTDAAWGDIVDGGTYTPTGTGVTNVDSVSPGEANWIRVGASVSVYFYAACDATAAGATTTVFRLSLPIASNFSASNQLSGSASTQGIWQAVDITADTTNDEASVRYTSPVTTAIGIVGTFGYRII